MDPGSIVVLDFGSQYTQLIARRIRELKVFSEILPSDTPTDELKEYEGIVLSGGPSSVYLENRPDFDPELFSLGIPILGICYGMQLTAHHFGGKVSPGQVKEYGKTEIQIENANKLFSGLNKKLTVWMSHGDSVEEIPQGFKVLASTGDGITASIGHSGKKIYSVQFHPEVSHTEKGKEILKNFVFKICNCRLGWTMENFISREKEHIRNQVGDGKVLALVSGGVDSTVAATLALKALDSDQVWALYIDTGLMRKGETELVEKSLKKAGIENLIVADYSKEFLSDLKRVYHPEEKRKIIGDKFIQAQEKELKNLGVEEAYLVQGTLYTDLIESGKGVGDQADRIKTHHNVASPLIEKKREEGRLVEPNREIFKDEVRTVGRLLGLPEKIVSRQPFPGPALGVRIICGPQKFEGDFSRTNSKLNQLSRKAGLKAHLTPVRTVGVQGDLRTYKNLALLSGKFDWEKARKTAESIVKNLDKINRVAFVLNSREELKEDSFREVKPIEIRPEYLNLLRKADNTVTETLRHYNLLRKISQVPVVLFPGPERPWIALRPVKTEDFMTARPIELPKEIPERIIEKLTRSLMKLDIDGVAYDITDKPPGTIEWE